MRVKPFALTSAALTALLLTAACGASSPAPAAAPTAAPLTAGPAASTSPSPTAQVVTLTVKGGKVTGDTGRIQVRLGSVVQLVVTSDVADEVHVHTYDKHLDLTVGQPGTLSFTADIPAIVEVELEGRKLLLTRLAVS